jgi:hypothetical protein
MVEAIHATPLMRRLPVPIRPSPAREARLAELMTWVDCVGCGQPFRGRGLLCRDCRHQRPDRQEVAA